MIVRDTIYYVLQWLLVLYSTVVIDHIGTLFRRRRCFDISTYVVL